LHCIHEFSGNGAHDLDFTGLSYRNAISHTEEAHWSLPRPGELPTFRLRLFQTS